MSAPQNVRIEPPPASAGQPWTVLLLVSAAAFAVFGNTRIGGPTSYGDQSEEVFVGYVLAFGLLIGAVMLMVVAVLLRRVPPLLLPVSMLVAVLAILQWLPEVETGLVIFPNLPWSYSGWIPVVLSVAAWFFLLLAILTSGAHDAAVVVPLFLLWMLALSIPFSFWSATGPFVEHKAVSIAAPWEQVAEWRMTRAEAQQVLANLRCDRERLAGCLSRLGLQSSADLKDVPAARPVAKELAEVVGQIRVVEEKAESLDLAISEIESNLRRVDRREAIGKIDLTDEEEKKLIRRQMEVEEELGQSILNVDALMEELLVK